VVVTLAPVNVICIVFTCAENEKPIDAVVTTDPDWSSMMALLRTVSAETRFIFPLTVSRKFDIAPVLVMVMTGGVVAPPSIDNVTELCSTVMDAQLPMVDGKTYVPEAVVEYGQKFGNVPMETWACAKVNSSRIEQQKVLLDIFKQDSDVECL